MGSSQLASYLTGTLGLTVVFLVAAGLAFNRPRITNDSRSLRHLKIAAAVAIGAQALHFIEELVTGFYLRFPAELGLEPWSSSFFVAFNLIWLTIWVLATLAIRTRATIVLVPLWFLALALLVNGVAHPILALRVSGYFPGLLTSPLVAVSGGVLLYHLTRSTSAPKTAR